VIICLVFKMPFQSQEEEEEREEGEKSFSLEILTCELGSPKRV
jgi:hypothetical protein